MTTHPTPPLPAPSPPLTRGRSPAPGSFLAAPASSTPAGPGLSTGWLELVADVFEVPVAVITLVDADSVRGSRRAVGVTVRKCPEDAFCNWADRDIGQGLFEVADAGADPRFAGNPMVCGEDGVPSAGLPLRPWKGWPWAPCASPTPPPPRYAARRSPVWTASPARPRS